MLRSKFAGIEDPVATASTPVSGADFLNRKKELTRLEALVDCLVTGRPEWLAMIGERKVGKTSLLLELQRQRASASLSFVVVDALEEAPRSVEFYRFFAARVLDAILGAETGRSLTLLLQRAERFQSSLLRSDRFLRLNADLREQIAHLPSAKAGSTLMRFALELPQSLAQALDLAVLVAIDEFQELAEVGSGRRMANPLATMRSIWQRHDHVAYVISGSARSMLLHLVTSEHSPFFAHFDLLQVGAFDDAEAEQLLQRAVSQAGGGVIPSATSRRLVKLLGGYPFYLQVVATTLASLDPPLDESALKEALQQVLFSRTGRLSLMFKQEATRAVGRSRYLAAVLETVADGPMPLSKIVAQIGATSGATATYLDRLKDQIVRQEDGTYSLFNPVFGLWLQWQRPGGAAVPMSVLGDEAERAVALQLAELGFELVYQSRASRGAFDLLAIRGPHMVGLQVKRCKLPARFAKSTWQRMTADAERFGWRWLLAVVDDGAVLFLDPKHAEKHSRVVLRANAQIENLLAWL